MHRNYSTAFVALYLTLFIAVFIAWQNFSSLAFVLFSELALLVFAVLLLSRNLPRRLNSASKQNCFRMDGSRSEHRTFLESSARWKLQADVCASLLLVLMIGNGLLLAVHYLVIPLPLGFRAMESFQADRQAWKQDLERGSTVARFKQSYRENHQASPQEAEEAAADLWDAWPFVVLAGIVAAVAAQAYVGAMYQRSLAEYARGIAFRAEEYERCDIARLQREFEIEAQKAAATAEAAPG